MSSEEKLEISKREQETKKGSFMVKYKVKLAGRKRRIYLPNYQ